MMTVEESAFGFVCEGVVMRAILHRPLSPSQRGLLVVVGGPQYRIGSHRQFVLLARALAAQDVAVMRFDCRGMGDSEGTPQGFENISSDIGAAVDTFIAQIPEMHEVVLWGLCDAAFAAATYVGRDPRVTGLVLLNPWVRSAHGQAVARLKYYYLRRLWDPAVWRRIRRGEIDFVATTGSLYKTLVGATGFRDQESQTVSGSGERHVRRCKGNTRPLADRMLEGLMRYEGRVLFILSGEDLTAAEFRETVAASRQWRKLLREARVSRRDLAEADHTFSRSEWRGRVTFWTLEWLKSW
jgi:exosortase A-associated hydrolase 1